LFICQVVVVITELNSRCFYSRFDSLSDFLNLARFDFRSNSLLSCKSFQRNVSSERIFTVIALWSLSCSVLLTFYPLNSIFKVLLVSISFIAIRGFFFIVLSFRRISFCVDIFILVLLYVIFWFLCYNISLVSLFVFFSCW